MAVRERSYWDATDTASVREDTVGSLLRRAAERAPDTVALVEGVADPEQRRRWTYEQLFSEAQTCARALLDRFAPGERVAVWANNIPEWILLQMGAAMAGVTLVTVDPALRATELRHVLGQSRSCGVFLRKEYQENPMADTLAGIRAELPELREAVLFDDWAEFTASGSPAQALPEVQPSDPAQIQYTSGTTGLPKGAVLPHNGLVNNARLAYSRLLQLVAEERSVLFGGVPTMLLALLDHPDFGHTDLSSVRVAVSGGAAVPPDLVRRVETELGAPMAIIYAQTESSPGITMTDPSADSVPSWGL